MYEKIYGIREEVTLTLNDRLEIWEKILVTEEPVSVEGDYGIVLDDVFLF